MAGEDSERQPAFKVQDRRRFSATGEARDDSAENAADARAETPPESQAQATPPPHGSEADAGAESFLHEHGENAAESGEITFASFVFSLSTQALVHLGEIHDPVDNAEHVNLEAARQIIDILAILRDKTAGNLDAAENALLENALYDLRMRYVDRARQR